MALRVIEDMVTSRLDALMDSLTLSDSSLDITIGRLGAVHLIDFQIWQHFYNWYPSSLPHILPHLRCDPKSIGLVTKFEIKHGIAESLFKMSSESCYFCYPIQLIWKLYREFVCFFQ